MSIQHHPSEALLMDYAAGALSGDRAMILSTHLAACPACREAVRFGEAVGGALLNEIQPTSMGAGALERALAALDAPPPPSRGPDLRRPRPDWITVPDDVIEAAARRKRWAAPGVWVAPISHDRASGRRAYLLRVGAGMAVPHHTHRGEELTIILKGAFKDRGHIYRPGDFAEVDDSVEHQPKVTREGECVCLVCADAPLVPLDWVGRLFQPFVRI